MTPKQVFFDSSAFFAYGADNCPPALDLPGRYASARARGHGPSPHIVAPSSLDSDNRTRERVSIQVSQVSPLVSQGSHHPTSESSILAPIQAATGQYPRRRSLPHLAMRCTSAPNRPSPPDSTAASPRDSEAPLAAPLRVARSTMRLPRPPAPAATLSAHCHRRV